MPSITLTTPSDGAAWMLLSNGWYWEGEDLRHQSGTSVSDAAAWNGSAWLGRGGRTAPAGGTGRICVIAHRPQLPRLLPAQDP